MAEVTRKKFFLVTSVKWGLLRAQEELGALLWTDFVAWATGLEFFEIWCGFSIFWYFYHGWIANSEIGQIQSGIWTFKFGFSVQNLIYLGQRLLMKVFPAISIIFCRNKSVKSTRTAAGTCDFQSLIGLMRHRETSFFNKQRIWIFTVKLLRYKS